MFRISKSQFIKHLRCKRFSTLESLNMIDHKTLQDIMNEEIDNKLKGLLESVIDTNTNLNKEKEEKYLNVMLPYYREFERRAMQEIATKNSHLKTADGKKASLIYGDIKNQKLISSQIKPNVEIFCFLDGFIEYNDDGKTKWKIYEAKTTTSERFKKMPCFYYDESTDTYEYNTHGLTDHQLKSLYRKIKNIHGDIGRYFLDIAFQKYVIEHYLKENNLDIDVEYYLVFLNDEYVKDVEEKSFSAQFNVTKLLKDYENTFELDQRINDVIQLLTEDLDFNVEPIYSKACRRKKYDQCPYFEKCFPELNDKRNIFEYIQYHIPFENKNGEKLLVEDLINEGKFHMTDIPESFLNRKNNQIQRNCIKTNSRYVNKRKMKLALEQIEYPAYHLDFETFGCPIPRFTKEKPYQQSVFQFSCHVEREPGICDFDKDHFEFLSSDNTKDERKKLVEKLLEAIPEDHGSIIAWNKTFEELRLRELAELYPEDSNEYKRLHKMADKLFDLMWVFKGSRKFYESINYFEKDIDEINFYDPEQGGSYSIKAILPILTDLSYDDLNDVHDGIDAMLTYASFDKVDEKEKERLYNNLKKYCKQDTWAMVLLLREVRKLVI